MWSRERFIPDGIAGHNPRLENVFRPQPELAAYRAPAISGHSGVVSRRFFPEWPGAAMASAAGNGNLAEQVLSAALSYRTHAPIIDSLLQEIGINGSSLQVLTAALPQVQTIAAEPVPEETVEKIAESFEPSAEHGITTVNLS